MSPEDEAKIAELQRMLKARGRGCGDCTACCTLMRVDMEPVHKGHKPERTRCRYECKAGCEIYADKPDSCTAFMCLWLATQLFDDPMPFRWRPDQVGAVLDVNTEGTITAHLKHENAWVRPGALRDMLTYLTAEPNPLFNSQFIILDRPSHQHLLFHSDGGTQQLVPIGVGPTGLKQFRTKFPGEE